jgi:NADPH:quinone reductase-like Zn-dependent oxidoreductase
VPVVVTDQPDGVDAVRDLSGGRTVGVALDPIGGAMSAQLLGLLSPGGTLVVYGRMAAEPIPIDAWALLGNGLTMRTSTIRRWVATTTPEQRASDTTTAVGIAQKLSDLFDTAGIYPIAQLSDAIRDATKSESRHRTSTAIDVRPATATPMGPVYHISRLGLGASPTALETNSNRD